MFNRARRLKTAPSSRPELDDANLSYPFNYSAGSGRKCNDDGDLWDYSRLDDIYIFFVPKVGKQGQFAFISVHPGSRFSPKRIKCSGELTLNLKALSSTADPL